MDWRAFRYSRRLELPLATVEAVYALLSEIDAVKNTFRLTGRFLPQTLSRLTRSVIVTSTGASNRIEGNRLTDDEVEALYRNLRIRRLQSRDEQEVAGYLEVLDVIFAHHNDMAVSESMILQLHRDMLRYSDMDARQRGQYKFGPNRVEAKDVDGKVVGVIFDPTPPHLTRTEMRDLLDWYDWAREAGFKHPLLVIGNLVFEFLAIHPFQDGNGRVSRLLTNLLLLQHGYSFASLVSHERLIEARRAEYYLALNRTQASWKSAVEDLSPWLLFILEIFRDQARQALALLEGERIEHLLSEKQLALWHWANHRDGETFSRKVAVAELGYPARTVEACIRKLVEMKRLERLGQGRASRYRVVRAGAGEEA